MDGPYNSEVILYVRLVWKNKKVTPFEGIRELSGGDGITKSQKSRKKYGSECEKEKEVGDKFFFKGPCNTVNLFSFLDSRVKGQYFEPFEK